MAKSPLEEWIKYLKDGVISAETTAPGLREARQKLQYYSMDDAERHAYDEHINAVMIQNDVRGNARQEGLEEGLAEGLAKGLAKGLEEGLAKGRDERSLEIAKSLLDMGAAIDKIMNATGLDEEQIRSLR